MKTIDDNIQLLLELAQHKFRYVVRNQNNKLVATAQAPTKLETEGLWMYHAITHEPRHGMRQLDDRYLPNVTFADDEPQRVDELLESLQLTKRLAKHFTPADQQRKQPAIVTPLLQAYAAGMRYAARNSNQIVYLYAKAPVKYDYEWKTSDPLELRMEVPATIEAEHVFHTVVHSDVDPTELSTLLDPYRIIQ